MATVRLPRPFACMLPFLLDRFLVHRLGANPGLTPHPQLVDPDGDFAQRLGELVRESPAATIGPERPCSELRSLPS